MGVLFRRLSVLLLPLTLIGCENLVEKSSNPLTPTVAGPMAGINIDVPGQLSPGGGTKLDDDQQPVSLVVGNPGTNSPRPVVLGVQVATDVGFANIAFSRDDIAQGDGGRTTVRLNRLTTGRTYYWRVKAADGANDSGWSNPLAFDVLNPVVIGVPTPKSPIGGGRIASFLPVLVVVNGQTSGPVGNIRYQYQVSDSAAFASLVVSGEHIQDPSGESSFAVPAVTALDKLFFWRARILGERHTGEWSRVESFRTPLSVVTPPGPSVPPPSATSLSQCGPPVLFNPQAILDCHRSFYGSPMSESEHVSFLKGALASLNAANTPGGPFGLLRKTSGSNCNGYSCDVICNGQGNDQKQWDILINSDRPSWGGSPATVANGIRVDFCEVP